MEWDINNPGRSIFYGVLVIVILYDVTFGKKIRKRHIEKQINKNKLSLCARCNQEYHNDYYTVRKLKYCSACFKRMLYDVKLGGGFVALLAIGAIAIMITLFIQKLVHGNISSDDYWWALSMSVMFGSLFFMIARSYSELKKAEKEHL